MADVFQFEDDNHTDGNFDNDDNDEIILDDVSHFTSFPFHFFLLFLSLLAIHTYLLCQVN
jgi:hypothetical protein